MGDHRFILPKPYPEFCTKRVLAMSFEEGVPVAEAAESLSQERKNKLAEAVLDLYFHELFVWRKVQTDPHFGNYRVRLGKSGGNDRLVLFDYGAVREVPKDFLDSYRSMLAGLFFGKRGDFERGAEKLGVLKGNDPDELKDLFYSLCSAIVEPFSPQQPYDWKGNDLPKRVSKITWELVRKFPLRSPPKEVVFLDRKMAGMFTFLSVLSAKFDSRKVLVPHLS
jgi:predicted unusual protein kinase regulating ubiquinone biosynthesis (AarF/ABC1/UbiB family)